MFHKNISFYRKYLKSRTENYIYLLPVDAIPPERLKDKPLNLLTEFISTIPILTVKPKKTANVVYLDLYSTDVSGNTNFIASAHLLVPDFFADNVNVYYFKFDSKCFFYVEYCNDVDVRVFEVKPGLSHWIDFAYNYFFLDNNTSGNAKCVPPVNIDYQRPVVSIDGLYQDDQDDQGLNDRRGKDV